MSHRNADATLNRTGLILAAFRKIGVAVDQARGIEALNLILREESARLTGTHRFALWAQTRRALALVANKAIYTTGDGLAADIRTLDFVLYRDTNGNDTPVTILARSTFDALTDKNSTGTPTAAYLLPASDPASQQLWVHPVRATIGTASTVTGSDGNKYVCIMGHTARADNRPTSGTDWPLYWDAQGTTGATWVTGTAYTNSEMLLYTYRRPLYDFDNPTDNPDMPPEWTRYLVYRLARDLAPEYAIALDERQWLASEAESARETIFPGLIERTQSYYNKVAYF